MPTRKIDELIWTALTDHDFRARLLNGHRCETVNTFGLTEAERQTVLAVQANTLETFAGALCGPGPSPC